jgi:hypothetical protein
VILDIIELILELFALLSGFSSKNKANNDKEKHFKNLK